AGPDGVSGTGAAFPTQTYQSSNYWVDVVFNTSAVDTSPPRVVSTSPAAGATGVAASTVVQAAFSKPMAASSISASTFTLVDGSGTAVPATVSYDGPSSTATLTPTAPLAASATYTARVKASVSDT